MEEEILRLGREIFCHFDRFESSLVEISQSFDRDRIIREGVFEILKQENMDEAIVWMLDKIQDSTYGEVFLVAIQWDDIIRRIAVMNDVSRMFQETAYDDLVEVAGWFSYIMPADLLKQLALMHQAGDWKMKIEALLQCFHEDMPYKDFRDGNYKPYIG